MSRTDAHTPFEILSDRGHDRYQPTPQILARRVLPKGMTSADLPSGYWRTAEGRRQARAKAVWTVREEDGYLPAHFWHDSDAPKFTRRGEKADHAEKARIKAVRRGAEREDLSLVRQIPRTFRGAVAQAWELLTDGYPAQDWWGGYDFEDLAAFCADPECICNEF